jgi:hypothetical protein
MVPFSHTQTELYLTSWFICRSGSLVHGMMFTPLRRSGREGHRISTRTGSEHRASYRTHKGRSNSLLNPSGFPKIDSDYLADAVGFAALEA